MKVERGKSIGKLSRRHPGKFLSHILLPLSKVRERERESAGKMMNGISYYIDILTQHKTDFYWDNSSFTLKLHYFLIHLKDSAAVTMRNDVDKKISFRLTNLQGINLKMKNVKIITLGKFEISQK